jgi:hypothetical protein
VPTADTERSPPRIDGPRTLADLAERATVEQFALPDVQEGKIAAAGIRKLTSPHLTLYTDVPSADEVDELPAVFEAAIPLWCAYFQLDPAKLAEWRVVGCLIRDRERFQGAGLYPEDLPDFPNGFSRGSQFWWFEQPSAYYRRHLMLHEGTHAFMTRWLGGAGPPWYMEGMAELLGTHRWDGKALQLAQMPTSKDEVPYWGRIKIVKDEFAAGRGMQLTDVMRYDAQAHLRNEPYGWCWAAAHFLFRHPKSHDLFRALGSQAADRSIDFSNRFYNDLQKVWPEVAEEWQLFVMNLDYGYDVARAAVVRKPAEPLPPAGATATLDAARGWQSTGIQVEAGKTYQLTAAGRFQVAQSPEPWWCEPGGITLHYYQQRPLGMLLAGVGEVADPPGGITPLVHPTPIGLQGQFIPSASGVLFLSINESPAGLADNSGAVAVRVEVP